MKSAITSGCARCLFLLSAVTLHGATLSVYLTPPAAQASQVAGVTTENFNSLPLGIDTTVYNSTIGTFEFTSTNKVDVLAADQYGGANGSDYIALGAQSSSSAPVTVKLNGLECYFGFWWSAGDANNGISFYNGNNLLVRYSTADILKLLTPKTGTVTALDGVTQYTNSQFYGNPNNTSQDAGEPFAYVNFVASGVSFNKLVLDNSGTTSTGFEMDNFSILAAAPTIPTTHVLVEQVAATPEPSTAPTVTAFLIAMAMFVRARTRS